MTVKRSPSNTPSDLSIEELLALTPDERLQIIEELYAANGGSGRTPDEEKEIEEVRQRWIRLRKAFGVRKTNK